MRYRLLGRGLKGRCFSASSPFFFRPGSRWNRPSRFQPGEPAPAASTQGQIPGTALHLLSLRPPLSRAARRVEPPARRFALGPVRPSAMETLSPLPRSLPAKAPLQRHFLEGTRPLTGRPLGGLTGCPPDVPGPLPSPAFFYREPRWKRDPRKSSISV